MKKLTHEEAIQRYKTVHGVRYDISHAKYEGAHIKWKLICPIHGEFWQSPNHGYKGVGCPRCSDQRLTQQQAIEKYKKIHGRIYDYSKAVYINHKTEWKLICPIHGEFYQTPNSSFSGQGCKKCYIDGTKLTQSQALQRYENVHKGRYDTTKAIYVDIRTEWKLICPIHGEFWQQPRSGFAGRGCSKCNKSTGELSISHYLKNRNINYVPQKKFIGLTGLGDGRLSYDFYIPNYNICIEYDGKQHFEPIDYWGGKKYYTIVKEHDKRKTQYCKKYNIELIRIPYWNIDIIEDILSNAFA